MTENDEKMDKKKEKKLLIPERKPDSRLWTDVKRLSEGTDENKTKAIDIIFEKNYSLPEEANELLKKMASKNESPTVRRRIAELLQKKLNIPRGVYYDVLDILSEDDDPEVKEIVAAINEELTEMIKPFIDPFEIIYQDYQEYLQRIVTESMNLPLEELYQRMLEQFQPISYHELLNSSKYFDTIISGFQNYELLTKFLASVRPGFYSSSVSAQSEVISKDEEIEHELITRLEKISPGTEHWREYQSLCKEILDFCLVPPLSEPFEEERTEGGLHRRDLIYPLPYDIQDFWFWIRIMHSAWGIIVDCKNYSEPLGQNEVFNFSKYLSYKKLGEFGILISRRGISNNGKKQQKSIWSDEKKMIVCLSDEDLKQMIRLKLKGEDPEIVINTHIYELRKSLEV